MHNIYMAYGNNDNYIHFCCKATHYHARTQENTGSTTSFDTLCKGKLFDYFDSKMRTTTRTTFSQY